MMHTFIRIFVIALSFLAEMLGKCFHAIGSFFMSCGIMMLSSLKD